MIRPDKRRIAIFVLAAVMMLIVPVLAAQHGTTELHIAKYASDNKTVLNETTVDYLWMEENLPVYGDGRTHYYMEGPVIEDEWDRAHPNETYDAWDPDEDVQGSITRKGDLGAVRGTNVVDLCDLIGGAGADDRIAITCRDGWRKMFPSRYVYDPDPRQGPLVVCWFNGDEVSGEKQGVGYPDTCYTVGMRAIFFADTSGNPWGWHVFGATDMKECWDKKYWNYGAQYPSAVGTSGKWVSEIGIYTQELPPVPVAGFEANATSDLMPLAVGFNDTSTAHPTARTWDFGDGTTSTVRNPAHVYTVPGTYTVSLMVSNVAGTANVTETDYITVLPAVTPRADFTVNATSGEAPFAVQFADTSSGKPTSWSWDFGDGNVSAGRNPVHVYASPGTYAVTLAVKNSMGSDRASSSVTADVPVPAPPIVSFSADVTSGDAPVTVTFADRSLKSPTSWSWDFGDGATSDEQHPVHVYASPGVYTVSLTATNTLGSGTATEPHYIAATENGTVIIFRGTVDLGDGTFSVTAPSGKTYTPNQMTPMGALDAAAKMRNFTYVIGDKKYTESHLLFLDGVNQYLLDKTAGKTWICYHNGKLLDDYAHPSTEAFNGRAVADGDSVVFYYGDFYIYSTGKMEPKGGKVNPDNAIAVINMTIRTGAASAGETSSASSAGAAASSSPAEGAATTPQESAPPLWAALLAVGLVPVLRRS
ncbi:MAG: hypothetical protein PWP08_638 [Methanofollis sp.]|nr:hypothetical protein [Methanofollis sp.]